MTTSSPFESVHKRMGADFSEYHGWRLPRDYGDAAAEGKALEQGSAAFDLSSFGKITVKGSQSESLVSKLLGQNSEMPGEGKWIWSSAGDTEQPGNTAVRLGKAGGLQEQLFGDGAAPEPGKPKQSERSHIIRYYRKNRHVRYIRSVSDKCGWKYPAFRHFRDRTGRYPNNIFFHDVSYAGVRQLARGCGIRASLPIDSVRDGSGGDSEISRKGKDNSCGDGMF